MQDDAIIKSIREWIDSFVIEFNLCPFVKYELHNNRVRISATEADTVEQLLTTLHAELELLNEDASIETTLLIHPEILQDFYEYNEFLGLANDLLRQLKLVGIYQIVSFHPDYQFSGTNPDDLENYTNRSPYPMLHLLREDSLAIAIDKHPNTDEIPLRNIELMKSMGKDKLHSIMRSCFKE